jgi:hypothetical protein
MMHQMRISTNQASSVVLRPKKLEIRKNLFLSDYYKKSCFLKFKLYIDNQ